MRADQLMVDIFDIKNDYNLIATLEYYIDDDPEYETIEISEYLGDVLLEFAWYYPDGLRIIYEVKKGIIYKTETCYE